MSKFMRGSPILMGNNTVPGLAIPEELKKLIPTIFKSCKDFGLDFYPTVVQMLTYDEMSEIASYDGFPVRFPHWKWGMEYEEMQQGYMHGMHRIFELVINTNPCYIYCLDSNTLVDNVTVIAHALGHNDFFKNNIYFSPTSQNMMNQLANHGTRIRRYMARWGKEKVTEFIDHVLRIETLIDPAKAWERKVIKNPVIQDKREYRFPDRLKVPEGHDYMEGYVNPKGWIDKQYSDIARKDTAEQLDIFSGSTKDILGFIRDNAPLKPWQSDIVAMLYQESMYFAPQRTTKMLNEGWASFTDYNIMARDGLVGLGQKSHDSGIIEYSKHKMSVLGGKYSMNPYKLGFCLFLDIEERWNKGKFGPAYDECEDIKKKELWDENVGLGSEKVFEVRKHYNDFTAILEFFTQEFCDKHQFYEWEKYPNGEYKIKSRDHKEIKKKLCKKYINGGLPELRITDSNHRGKGDLFIEHSFDGRTLYNRYVFPVMQSLSYLWGRPVVIETKNTDAQSIVYSCRGPEDEPVITDKETYIKDYCS